ncbi:ATP-binding protein [Marinobacter xestospongiae]|uniref:ATP-binding protein n=1 Tax=Marinobacter xestospongiae TaxID=994319 RepID=UPI002002EAE5|nr:ATP-binding protein [Marinobacter xestospongiae]MCK7566008.1 ATP-binding protein [Marinobacter xestospongiae]
MNFRKGTPKSLTHRLMVLGVMPALVMFLVLLVFFTSARLDDARKELYNSSQILADNLAPAVEYAVVSGNTQLLEQILTQTFKRSHVKWIRVTDVTDRVVGEVGDSPAEGVDATSDVFTADILQRPLDMEEDDDADWFEPVYGFTSGVIRLGTVEVGVSEQALVARQKDIVWSSVIVGLSLLAFTLLLVRRTLHSLVHPIHLMAERINTLMTGDYREAPVDRANQTSDVLELEQNLNALARHMASLKASRDQTLEVSETARERAESANRAKSEFLATMSHELRTPLNGVLGMIELIAEDELNPRQQDYLGTARHATEDLLTIISDILDISRMDRGKLALDYHDFDLRQVIENCVATYRHASEQQGLQLSLQLTGNWPGRSQVKGDAPRLRQVLAGLLDNAIKFTDQGSITVIAEWHYLEEQCMVLQCTVRDSGSGIPTDRMKEIFKTFEQLDNSHSRTHGGTGIGLALVQKLVELMGGHVKVETDLGTGSSFSFEVPFELREEITDDQDRRPEPKPADPGSPNRSTRALVVEDNPVNQRVATALLTRLGFETDAVSNGKDALDRVRSSQFDYEVILMDCHMPVMDGFEATRTIRDWERDSGQLAIPIIALTADALPGTESACREAGMNDYLSKPVRKDKLRTVLSRWIRF